MPRTPVFSRVSHVAGSSAVGTSDNTLALAGVQVPFDGAIVETWSYNGRVNAGAAGAVTVTLRKRGTSDQIANSISVPDIATHVDVPRSANGPGNQGGSTAAALVAGELVDVFFDHTSGTPSGSPTCSIVVNWLV